jgi:hypothetical protein
MRTGRQWLAFDADFFFNPFTIRLRNQFGPAGIVAWVAFLCACKRSRTPGTIRYSTDAHLRDQLRLHDLELVDQDGKEWTLDDLWTFTGRQKQTRRTSHGGWMYVKSTHWERWQKDAQRDANAQRMAGKRRAHDAHTSRTEPAQKRDRDREGDREPPYPPSRGDESATHNDNGIGDFVTGKDAVNEARALMRGGES